MTRDERSVLDMLVEEFREFRTDDRQWKVDIDGRILRVETFVTSRQAVSERDAARGVSRRSYVATIVGAIGIAVSVVLGIVNLVT